MVKLFVAMSLTLALLFALIFGLFAAASYYVGLPIWTSIILAVVIVILQWLISPYVIRATTNMYYIGKNEYPWIWKYVEEICKAEKIPIPKIAIARIGAPNAFVFGRTPSSATLVLTNGLLKSLERDEIKAVIGHELGHIKNKDMVVMLSLIHI